MSYSGRYRKWLAGDERNASRHCRLAGAQMVLIVVALIKRWPRVKHLFGDAAYGRRKLMDKAVFLDFMVEVMRRLKRQQGCTVQPNPSLD